jgi:DNA-binding response OmpR family regulator
MSDLREKRILVIDDNREMLLLVARVFAQTEARLYTATSGQEGLRKLLAYRPDLVLLDVMMPDLDGWTICRQIRRYSEVPIILLSVLDREKDIVRGLDCGADYYLTKPFYPNVLLARVRAALRRCSASNDETKAGAYSDDYLTIDPQQHCVLAGGQAVELNEIEYRLLLYLLQNACRVLTVGQILNDVWENARQGDVEYVHTYIWRLRQKLEQNPGRPQYLLSEHNVGYSFQMQAH